MITFIRFVILPALAERCALITDCLQEDECLSLDSPDAQNITCMPFLFPLRRPHLPCARIQR